MSEIDDIKKNLSNILNTKKGFGSFLKNFGIGDYNAFRSHDKVVETIIDEIKENIEKYESRVQLIGIEEVHTESPFRIRFELKCMITRLSKPIFLIFDSIIDEMVIED